MSIGNAINSLPIAYAPLNGTGRKVSYALSYQDVESAIGAVPSVISHALSPLDVLAELDPVPLRIAYGAVDGSISVDIDPVFSIILDGFTVLSATGGLSDAYAVMEAGCFAAPLITCEASPVPLQIHSPHCDFRSLYTPPGDPIVGNVLNSFALGVSAMNTSVGGVWRTFVTICDPKPNALFASPAVSGVSEVVCTPQGDALFAPFTPAGAEISSSPVANALYAPFTDLGIDAGASPFGSLYLQAGATTFVQDLAASSGFGVMVLGGKASPEILADVAPQCSILVYLGAEAMAEGAIAPVGLHIAVAFVGNDMEADISPQALRIRTGETDLQALAYIAGSPWDPIPIVVSTVYAQAWNETHGIDVIGSIVCQISPESIVYRVSPESIIYGDVS